MQNKHNAQLTKVIVEKYNMCYLCKVERSCFVQFPSQVVMPLQKMLSMLQV